MATELGLGVGASHFHVHRFDDNEIRGVGWRTAVHHNVERVVVRPQKKRGKESWQ